MNDLIEMAKLHIIGGPIRDDEARDKDYRIIRDLVAECERLAEHDAALVAERDEADEATREIGRSLLNVTRQRDAAREQLAAAEAVFAELRAAYPPTNSELYMEGGNGPFVDKGMEGYVEAFSVVHSILSGYPVSSALTERDAEKWAEGFQRGISLPKYVRDDEIANPYRVTPTEDNQ